MGVAGGDVSRNSFVCGRQLDAVLARAESSQLRHSYELPRTSRHFQQPRRHQETNAGHLEKPNQDRSRQGLDVVHFISPNCGSSIKVVVITTIRVRIVDVTVAYLHETDPLFHPYDL